MPLYRKKPVVIEARRLPLHDEDKRPLIEIAEWSGGEINPDGLIIHTLEGDHLGQPGDWIIKGVAGECYPCKPDIFERTYELADGA